MNAIAEPIPSPACLWQILREYIRHAWLMFGSPSEIAQRIWFTRNEARLIGDWLRALEMLLRRLVFLQALEFTPPPTSPPSEHKQRPRTSMPISGGAHFDLDHSDTWRAPFDLRARVDRRRPARPRRKAAPAVNAIAAAPLALRLEALVRGFNDPAPLVARAYRLLERAPRKVRAFVARVKRRDRGRPGFGFVTHANTHVAAALNPDSPDSS